MPTYDLLAYHDFTDNLHDTLQPGDDAGEKLGDAFENLRVVALGAPIHETKGATVVLAHSNRPMKSLQDFLDRSPS